MAVGKYIDILATCKSPSTLDKGLFSQFVNKRVGFRWRPGYFGPIKEVVKNTKSLPFGHPWLPFASWSRFPIRPPSVLLKFKVCSFIFLKVETNIIHYPNSHCFRVPNSRLCEWL